MLASPKSEHSNEELDVSQATSPTSETPDLVRHNGDGVTWTATQMINSRSLGDMASANERRPTYVGYIKSPADAILLLAACDLPDNVTNPSLGPPPRRISRRLLDDERTALIRSGAIFVWDEREAGMRRWTDGRCWSASRVSGCFLTYRELEVRKKTSDNYGKDGPRANLYKTDGLVKQSFSIRTSSNRKLHVISYYNKDDIKSGRLQRVSKDPRIMGSGIDSWNVQVDEHEYGELLTRETDYIPKHVMSTQHSIDMPADTKMSFKRTFSNEDPHVMDEYDQIQSPGFFCGRDSRPSYSSADYRYARSHTMGTYMDDPINKRYRFDRGPMAAHAYYHQPRAWPAAYEQQHTYPSPPVTTSLMDTKHYVSNGYKSYFSQGGTYANTMDRQLEMRGMERPVLPSLQSTMPRASEAERGTLEALASLRADAKVPPVSALDRAIEYPYAVTGGYPASRLRGRPAPVSVTDRHTLQKLSVPM